MIVTETFVVGDHNFTQFSIIPSVVLKVTTVLGTREKASRMLYSSHLPHCVMPQNCSIGTVAEKTILFIL